MTRVSSSEGIIVIATSMYQDSLPDSLTRSGRLEKCIRLERPNYEAREKIFKYYLDKHKVFENINPSVLAKKTTGFTGANIKQLVNEVLLEMNSSDKEASLSVFEEYIPVITFKDIKKVNEKETLKTVIPHEIGHFICSYVLKGESAVISVAKFSKNLGYTKIISKEKNRLMSEKDIITELVINLGGMAAEKVILGEVTLGSSSDIDQCITLIANAFESGIYGFEYKLLEYPSNYGPDEKIIPEKTKELIDNKKNELLNCALAKAEEIIKENIYIYDLLKDKLYEKDTLTSEEIDYILSEYNKKVTLN